MKDEIERARRTLDLYHRVCSESEEKPWEEIDNGLSSLSTKFGPEAWEAYMKQRMMHLLGDIVHAYDDTHKT